MTSKQVKALQEKVDSQVPELQSRLRILVTDLENENADQAELYGQVADLYAECYMAHLQLEQRHKEMKFALSLEIRANPGKFKLERPTEGAVDALLETNEDIVRVKRLRNTADGMKVRVQGLLNAFDHRRSALNNETDLFRRGPGSSIESAKNDAFTEEIRRIRKAKSRQA